MRAIVALQLEALGFPGWKNRHSFPFFGAVSIGCQGVIPILPACLQDHSSRSQNRLLSPASAATPCNSSPDSADSGHCSLSGTICPRLRFRYIALESPVIGEGHQFASAFSSASLPLGVRTYLAGGHVSAIHPAFQMDVISLKFFHPKTDFRASGSASRTLRSSLICASVGLQLFILLPFMFPCKICKIYNIRIAAGRYVDIFMICAPATMTFIGADFVIFSFFFTGHTTGGAYVEGVFALSSSPAVGKRICSTGAGSVSKAFRKNGHVVFSFPLRGRGFRPIYRGRDGPFLYPIGPRPRSCWEKKSEVRTGEIGGIGGASCLFHGGRNFFLFPERHTCPKRVLQILM